MPHETSDLPAHRNARSRFIFDVRPLGRQPGSSRAVRRSIPAPADFGIALVGVPEGADLELDIRLEAVMEGVLVSGNIRAPLTGECARCLDPLTSSIEVEFTELFSYLAASDAGSEATEENRCTDGDLVDLGPVCHDAVLLALPLSPLCSDECPGLCAECGKRLADPGPEHGHGDSVDPRWAPLRRLNTADSAAWIGRRHADDRQEG